MIIRLPFLLRRLILAAMAMTASVWTVSASVSDNTMGVAGPSEKMEETEFPDNEFKSVEESFFSLGREDEARSVLSEEGNLAYYVPVLNETIEFTETPSGISVIENAGLGNLQFKDRFSEFRGTLKATAGGTLTFLMDADFTLEAGIELSNASTLICVGDGSGNKVFGAISGQGTIIKRGSSRTVYLSDVSQKFEGDIIIEKGSIRLGEGNSKLQEIGYVFGEGSKGNFIVKNDAQLILRYGQKFYFSQNFSMENGSTLQVYEATGNIIYGNFFVGSPEGIDAKGVLLDLRRQTTLFLSGGLSGGRDAILRITNEEDAGNVAGIRDIILDGDVSNASERFSGTIRIYPHAAQDGIFNFYLNHSLAASDALFDLSGIDNNKMAVLKVGVDEATIRGLNGTAFTRVEGVGGLRTLVFDEGSFAGEVGANLSLKKQGAGTLILSGTNKDFIGDIMVTGGALHFSLANNRDYTGNILVSGGAFHFSIAANKAFTQDIEVSGGTLDLSVTNNKINSIFLGNGAHFILNGTGTIAGSLTGNGKLIKEGAGTLEFVKTSTCAFEGDVEIREGILKIQTAGADDTDAYVLSTQNSTTGTITLSKDAQLLFNDGTPRSRLLVNKQVVLEDGASIKLVNGISFGALFKEAVVFQKGIKVNGGVATILFDQDRLVLVQGLRGTGILKVEDTPSGMWSRPRILDLSGEGDFEGEIQVNSIKKDKAAYVNLRLRDENAAQNAVINLQGQAYGTSNSVSSRLTLVAKTATIAGLTGNQYSSLASSDDELRTLVINGGGIFAGFLGEHLSLTKSGNDSTLTLTGANSSMTEKIKVTGGTLSFTSTYGQVNSDLELANRAFLSLVADTADLELTKTVSGTGNIIKTGSYILNMTNAAGELAGDILVKEGVLSLSGAGIVGNVFGKGKSGNISVSDGAVFRLDGGSGYIIDKNFRMESGSLFSFNSTGSSIINGTFEVQKAITDKGSGTGVVFEFSGLTGNRTVSLTGGLSGYGTLIIRASGNGNAGARVVSLDGDVSPYASRFCGVIEIAADGEPGNEGGMVLMLNDSLVASDATIRLLGKDVGTSCLPVLRIGAEVATIAGLNGDAASLVEGAEGAEHTLVVNGGGHFAGTFGGNLVLIKSGEGVLNLTGTGSSFDGMVKVTGGTLKIGERELGASGKMTVDVNGGTLQLDNTAVLGNVNLSSGTFDFAHEGSSVDVVTVSGGEMTVTANGNLLSLNITGEGLVTVSSNGLAISSHNPVSVMEQGKIVFSGDGLLASGVQLNLSGSEAVAEIAKSEINEFSTVLQGNGIFRINNNAAEISTTYSGNSDSFTGTVEINSGKLVLSGSLRQAAAWLKDGALLELGGAGQQIKSLLGNTGKVCFSNNAARITNKALFASYGGTLLMDRNQRVTFSRTSQDENSLMGGLLALEFSGGNGELVLENSFTGIMSESVRDVVLGSPGTIVLSGENISLRLNGSSWYGEVAAGNTLLLKAGTNSFYVDPALNENLLLNVRLEVTEATGDTVSGGVLIDSTGKLIVNVPLELLSSPFVSNADQSYKISRDNSLTGGEVSFLQDTLVRDLIIYAGREEGHVNTGLVLGNSALKLKMGRLIISGDSDYAISGGSLGFLYRAEDSAKAEFLISQESAGTVTVSSTLDATIHLLNKGGEGDLVLSGRLKNTGGIHVESGKLTLTGSSDNAVNAWLTNKGQLALGDGKNIYTVNYAGLRAAEGSETTFDDKTVLGSDFVINNAGEVHFATGGSLTFVTAITGYKNRTGTTHLGNNTSLTLPQGSDQNYVVDEGSLLTWNISQAVATGKIMTGGGQVILNNISGGLLDLSGTAIGTGWTGFIGTLVVTGDQPVALELGHLGNGAAVILSAGSKLMDKADGIDIRSYNITLGDNAVWQFANANGTTYRGTLTLGANGTLTGAADKEYILESYITGGTLHLTGGTYHLAGSNTQALTYVGANTVAVGSTLNAFGKGLLLDQAGSLVRVTGTVNTGTAIGNENGTLELTEGGQLTVTNGANWSGTITGKGTFILGGSSTLTGGANNAEDKFSGMLNVLNGSSLVLESSLGTAAIHIGQGATLDITGNTRLADNSITLDAGATITGGETYNGRLSITGNNQDAVTSNGNLGLDTLHLADTSAKLNVTGNLTVANGGSFAISDTNAQSALATVDGYATLGGVFDLILDVNNTFTDGAETKNFMLFKAQGGLNVTTEGSATQLKLDTSLEEFFTLDQNDFKDTGIVSVTRKEMISYLLDPTHVGEGGDYHDGYVSVNNVSYLGANAANGTGGYASIFYFDRKYTIAQGDDAYRLTNGDAWMNFHVKMTDTGSGAPTKLVVRENWMSISDESGIILSVRGSADDTYTGGAQIYQAKVKIDGTVNDQGISGSSALENGDVYFLGTGRVELTGAKAALFLNTGGNNSKGEYTWNNDILLQQGAMIEQTSSNNILAGNLKITDNALLRNTSDQTLTLSGKNITGNQLKIQGSGNDDEVLNTIELAASDGGEVNASLALADVSRNANLTIGREATAHITSLYLDKNSQVTVTLGGTLALKEVRNGINGAGVISLHCGTFKVMDNYAIEENGILHNVTGTRDNLATMDTNGYCVEVNQDISGWNWFQITGGGSFVLNQNMRTDSGLNGTVTGKGTIISIGKDKILTGTWTVKDGGTLQTKENVSISGTLNIEAGGKTDFGLGTWMDKANINLRNGATYSGFLKGEGGTITFENGSHFQVKTEDLRKLTEMSGTPDAALLIADTINIQNGNGFFRFTGGDGIVNDALLDAGQTKTLIYGKETITVGGLGNTTATTAHDLTDQQLAAMIGDNTCRWLTFQLTADKAGDTGSKLNLTVTRNVNFGELAQTANETAIAPTLSHIGMEGGKADSTLIGEQLNQLGLALTKATDNAGQMLRNISQSTSSLLNGYTIQRENLRRHTYDLRDRAVQERPCALRHQYETLENTLWANGIGGTYTVDGDANAVGHTTSQWGGQLGLSRCVNDNLVMGLSFTYTDSELTLDQGMGKATSSAYYIDLYAKYYQDNWNLTGVITGGFTDLDTTRHMTIPGYSSTTKGSTTGNQIMGLVELGYEIDLYGDRSNILEPFATVNAGYSAIDGFSETGAGTAGLNAASQSMASSSLGAGLRYIKEFNAGADNLQKGRFEVRAMVLQDLTDTATDVEAHFIGAPGQSFTQKSVEPGKTGLLLGTGIVIPATMNLSFFADLDGEFRDAETGGRANIGVKYAF